MAFPVITYDAANGSDTAASGAGGATAVTGTNGSGTAGTSTFSLNEEVDFTGVADDGSDALWCESTANERHLFRITAFNPSVAACTTLTTTEVIGATNITTANWAVGGKRKTVEADTAQSDDDDMADGWNAEFEAGTYTITAAIRPQGGTAAIRGPTVYAATAKGSTPSSRS